MKVITRMTLATVPAIFLLFVLLAGCGTTGEVEDQASAETSASASTEASEPASTERADDQTATAEPMEPQTQMDPFEDPNNLLSQRVVYFDFDSSAIRDDALPVIRAHADYLASNSQVNFTLEGHADERGTREYNLALGERRADAVRRLLIANGVSPAQVRVVSYGEERPAVLGHDESAWSMNRRAELVYANR
ncbi:MAG: peptidoglycan-associated lipoprotein Pal [Gammaproteobacteria bacterium]|nr:peptidoglycan-associated lipoprotein Pal [Gammaproteobacteria bacterium]